MTRAGERLKAAFAHREAGRIDAAFTDCAEAVRLAPANPDALHLFGLLHCLCGREAEGIALLDRAALLAPQVKEVWHNLARAVKNAGGHPAPGPALAALLPLLRSPTPLGGAIAHAYALARALEADNRPGDALAGYEAITPFVRPEERARFGTALAITRLLGGDFAAGWAGYESRLDLPDAARPPTETTPRWAGAPLAGQRILLRCEQGFGDVLQFVRYVPWVMAQGGTVVLEAPARLVRLLAGALGVEVVEAGVNMPPVDIWSPLLSLPGLAGTRLDTIPADVPYLTAPSTQPPRDGRRDIGLVWSGNRANSNDHRRSIPVAAVLPLLAVPNCRFHLLQPGLPADEIALLGNAVVNHGPSITDLADAAGLVAGLDLVISVDTALAHLAGAMARPVWVLLPYAPDWRWLLGRDDSPWYPTARLYRQPRAGDWASVLAAVVADLRRG